MYLAADDIKNKIVENKSAFKVLNSVYHSANNFHTRTAFCISYCPILLLHLILNGKK